MIKNTSATTTTTATTQLILNMNYLILFTIIYLLLQIKYVTSEKLFSRFRKVLLKRAYIVSAKKEKIDEYSFKIIENTKNKVENIHDYTVKKCYNINVFYNNLTESEREFMQAVMLLIV
jgi:hypothetical protein